MNKIGYVILHYISIEDTVNCVNSILEINKDADIVIVDNASPNESGKKIKAKYSSKKNISVILNNKNLGFAKGNNVGIDLLKDRHSFIVVLNNDTKIITNDFEKIIKNKYLKTGFAVMGPQIITRSGSLKTNPVENVTIKKSRIIFILLKKIIKYLICKLHLDFFINNVGEKITYKNLYDNNKEYENVKLHGACWIFSEKFFEKFEHLNEATFLYFEEDILFYQVTSSGLKTFYTPDIKICHLEDSSTEQYTKTSHKKNLFVLKNEIKSLIVLYNIVK